jgi:hypothetical protein
LTFGLKRIASIEDRSSRQLAGNSINRQDSFYQSITA